MQAWQIGALVAGILFPVLGVLQAYLLNQVRVELGAVRITMLEGRAIDAKEVRSWVEGEFARREALHQTHEALGARLLVLESRRRSSDVIS